MINLDSVTTRNLVKKNQKRLENTSTLFLPEFSKKDVIKMILPLLPIHIQKSIKNLNVKFETLFEPLKSEELIKQFNDKNIYNLLILSELIIHNIGYMRFYVDKYRLNKND